MPRIDPVQLLKCLSVLLSPHGGIKSGDEVQRLANLMTKFSKKLVSKCIYIQILKCTESDLLGLFMGSGGWQLVHVWLTESIVAKNWPLVQELLELLLVCPVDTERLKSNNCPKLVKELSKDGNHQVIRALASKLVEQWLKTVKGEDVVPIKASEIPHIIGHSTPDAVCIKSEVVNKDIKVEYDSAPETNVENQDNKVESNGVHDSDSKDDFKENCEQIKCEKLIKEEESEALPILKITVKDGKQVVSQVEESSNKTSDKRSEKDKSKHRSKDKPSESSSSKSSSSRHSSKSHSDKHRNSSSSHRSSSSSKSSNSSPSSHKDKSRERDKSSSHSSSKSSKHSDSSKRSSEKNSSSHKSNRDEKKDSVKDKTKEKSESKDNTTVKTETPSIQKLGKIPKLSDKKEKPSISIEVRKPDEPKPKTVKTFHSRFRKHGLEEEVKPPPSRASIINKKPLPTLPPTVSIPKRPSPVHNETPPEKKVKTVDNVEKPGAIKLIPAKPKPVLLESDMFMDALNASATNKKEPKKRKRRTSGSKDGNSSSGSPPHTPVSPSAEKSVPPRFYQDTLEAEEEKDKSSDRDSDNNESNENNETPKRSKIDIKKKREVIEEEILEAPHTLTVNGLKGVLCYHKSKGPKKSIKWKPDSELEEIQYFELDETERVNVTKTFTDMKYQERINEREAFEKARNLSTDDIMEERTVWRPLIPIDCEGQSPVDYGKNSKERDIQANRQKGTLQALYYHKAMIPDSPMEPDVETHQYSEPNTIPLEDITGNQDNVSDFRNMPWPEPKGNAPTSTTNVNIPNLFPPNMHQFPGGFPNQQFPGVPNFQGPNMVPPADWPTNIPLMANGMPPGPVPPGAIPPGAIPPGIMMPPENMMMPTDLYGPANPMFPPVPDGFNMMEMNMGQNMFPTDFNMVQGQGPMGPDGFPDVARGGYRGGGRGRGSGGGGHWRGKGSGNWDGPPRGRGGGHSRGRGKSVCIYFQRKGSCRQGDNCSFLHPGVNCPY